MLRWADFRHVRTVVDGVSLHTRTGGTGEPVVLLHGWPQHSLMWHAVAPILAERFQVIVPDLPGCGGSAIPRDGSYDKGSLGRTVRTLVRELTDAPVRVVGYDHGAGVAYNYASAQPAEVAQLAVVEFVLPGSGYETAMLPAPGWHTGSNWQLALFTVPDVAEFAFRGRERELLTWFFWHGACNPSAVSPEHLQEYVDQIAKPGALRAGLEYYASVWRDTEVNADNRQTALSMPVLGVGGRHNIGPGVGKSLEALAGSVRTEVVEDAGHWLADENPDALAAVLLDFFADAAT